MAAVVLAGGGGSRFRDSLESPHKLLSLFMDRPLVCAAVDAALGASFDETIVVFGCVDLQGLLPEGVTAIYNSNWESGQASSLARAFDWCVSQGHDAVVVGLGDAPLIPSSAWAAVGASSALVAVASFSGKLHPPVRLHRTVWKSVPVQGDVGARSLWKNVSETEQVPCDGFAWDVDTPDDLARLNELAKHTGRIR